MVQVLKTSVRTAIVAAAANRFAAHGFHRTTLSAIAEDADVGVGTVYTYFKSKLHLLYAVYRPWLERQFATLEKRALAARNPHDRLTRLLTGLWRDIPRDNPGLANSLMEALATAEPGSGKSNDLLRLSEQHLADLLGRILPPERRGYADALVGNLLLMAYDGYVINRRLGDLRNIERIAAVTADLLLGRASAPSAVPARAAQSSSLRKIA